MGLSNDIISQFIKATRDEKSKGTESIVYAYAVDANHVRLDGAGEDIKTPVTSTVKMEAGQRVIVQIKNHSATVIGNVTDKSASSKAVSDSNTQINNRIDEFDYVVADSVTTEQLNAEIARIDSLIAEDVKITNRLTANEADISDLEADNVVINRELSAHAAIINTLTSGSIDTEFLAATYATIKDLEATNATVYNLSSTYATFADTTTNHLTAIDADIVSLETDKLSAIDAELRFANVDFANIGEAAIETFYSKTGLIDNLVVSAGSVTGTLVGVTIKGDIIEGGTVVADKLVIQGEDGLYYKLNTNGVTTEAEQTDYNSLNGSIITAKSITATKISVDDLVAFGATIGGFNIGAETLYSGVKESIDNSTSGVFLGSDGQVAFGNADSYLKFYAIYTYYTVSYNSTTETYTRSNLEAMSTVGELVEGARTTDGHQVYATNNVGMTTSYFCRVPTDYKLAISADSILFGSDSKYSMEDVKELTDHVKIGTYIDAETGETLPCVELSEMDSSFKMRLTNKTATFADGVNDSTVIDSDGIETENLRVKNDIRHYDYVWRRRANGNLGLMWMEVTE